MRGTLAVAVLWLCASADLARADLATGRDKLVAGDYKTAIVELGKVSGKDRPTARILIARAQLATGDYLGAESTITPVTSGKDATAIEAHLVLDAVRRTTGRDADARKDLEQLLKDHPDDRSVRTALGVLRHDQGEMVAAKTLFDQTISEFDKKKLDLNDADALYQLAEAARYTSQYELANDSYRAALKIKPSLVGAGLAWADLFSAKYASELAGQTIEEVFKINPNDPDAHAA
ncbi:MAG TPA: tetratricopeptide repeat protein, partial [Kofleriaceae bacterium]